MNLKYNIVINNNSIVKELKKLTNQIYKLLPNREEGKDWQKPLETIVEELSGANDLIMQYSDLFTPLLFKLQGLFTLTSEANFSIYRRIIFECLGIMNNIVKKCQS